MFAAAPCSVIAQTRAIQALMPAHGIPLSTTQPEISPLHLDAIGHGIYLRPYQPHELKRVLFARDNFRTIAFKDAQQFYQVPFGYEVDDSPPMRRSSPTSRRPRAR